LSYATCPVALTRRSTTYIRRLLKAASAGGLPIQAPTGLELIVNLKTAHAMDLYIPPQFLRRADEVIE